MADKTVKKTGNTKSQSTTKETATSKTASTPATSDNITLQNFQIKHNISDMLYAGLKSDLGVSDDTLKSEAELEKALEEYENKPAFKEE